MLLLQSFCRKHWGTTPNKLLTVNAVSLPHYIFHIEACNLSFLSQGRMYSKPWPAPHFFDLVPSHTRTLTLRRASLLARHPICTVVRFVDQLAEEMDRHLLLFFSPPPITQLLLLADEQSSKVTS